MNLVDNNVIEMNKNEFLLDVMQLFFIFDFDLINMLSIDFLI